MRIAQVVPYSYRSFGGHEYYLARELSKLGHDVFLFTSDKIPPRYGNRRVFSDESEFFNAKRFSPILTLKEVPLIPLMLPSLYKTDLDIIHVHEYFQLCSYYGALTAKMKRIPLVLTQHGYNYPRDLFTKTAIQLSERCYGNFILNTSKRIIALSKATREFLEKTIGIEKGKIEVIPSGVDTIRFSPRVITNKKSIFHSLKEKKIILFVGRLVKYKGVESLIRAFGKISKSWPDVRLFIVGEGPEEPFLRLVSSRLKIEDKIEWFKYIHHNIISKIYEISDIFVLPSLVEPLGIVLLEAMASGKPVIATRVGGIPDIVSDGINGIIVEPNDNEGLENALTKLLDDDRLSRKMGNEGRQMAERIFSWKAIARRVLSIYMKILKE